jgi:hypothetical protein
VVVMHEPASGSGVAHFAPGGHAGAGEVGHEVCVSEKHTIPAAQSLSTLQGPGRHPLVTVGLHGGGAGQGWLGAHAKSAQPVAPVT